MYNQYPTRFLGIILPFCGQNVAKILLLKIKNKNPPYRILKKNLFWKFRRWNRELIWYGVKRQYLYEFFLHNFEIYIIISCTIVINVIISFSIRLYFTWHFIKELWVWLNPRWPPLLYIIPNFDAWWPPIFMIAIHVFVFKRHTFQIFQKLNHRNIFFFEEI